jgi:hypothetical protein
MSWKSELFYFGLGAGIVIVTDMIWEYCHNGRGTMTELAYDYYCRQQKPQWMTHSKPWILTGHRLQLEAYDCSIRFEKILINWVRNPSGKVESDEKQWIIRFRKLEEWLAELEQLEKTLHARISFDIDFRIINGDEMDVQPHLLSLVRRHHNFRNHQALFLSLFNAIVDRGGLNIVNDPHYQFLSSCYLHANKIFMDEIIAKPARLSLIEPKTWNFQDPGSKNTLFIFAVKNNDTDLIKFLCDVSDLEITNTFGFDALDCALRVASRSKTRSMVWFAYYVEFIKNREPKELAILQTTQILPPLVRIVADYLFDPILRQRILQQKNYKKKEPSNTLTNYVIGLDSITRTHVGTVGPCN